ncbi:MAG: uroporphyrinogen-III synthase [Parashewanella sp.]
MHVLLTRPAGRNQPMQDALKEKKIAYSVQPLMHIEPLAVDESVQRKLSQADIVIFISVNAVNCITATNNIKLADSASIVAIGSATQIALSELGINSITSEQSQQHSEGILSLDILQQVKDKKVVIVRGEGGREKLAEELILRGANVDYCHAYRRKKPANLSDDLGEHWQQVGVDIILISSGEILENLLQVVKRADFPWLESCMLIVPSARVALLARKAGLKNIVNAASARKDAMLAAILSTNK